MTVDSGSDPKDYRYGVEIGLLVLSMIPIFSISRYLEIDVLFPVFLLVLVPLLIFRVNRKYARRISVVDTRSGRVRIRSAATGFIGGLQVIDRPLGMCSCFEVVQETGAEHPSYFACVRWKDGSKHRLTLKKNSPAEARFVASRLAAATGMPTRDYEE